MKKFAKVMALSLVMVLAVMALVACAPNSNPEKAKAHLEEKDYIVVLTDNPTVIKLSGIEGLEASLRATNGEESITIYYFESASAARDFYKEEVKPELDDLPEGWKAACFGKIVYAGTEEAIKAAR